MSLFARLRQRFFPVDLPDTEERERAATVTNWQAAVQRDRAVKLMEHWDPKRAEDLRRIARTGNFVEGWLVPEPERQERPPQ